jgi:anti-anti-sigma factor
MLCQITSTIVAGEVIMDLAGRFCFLELRLRDQIRKLLEEGNRHFLLDLSNLTYLDSFGLGQLVAIQNSIQEAGGSLKLLRPPGHVQKLLQITRLDTIFDIVSG